jgi:uncharacterized protein (TIGR02246 family)
MTDPRTEIRHLQSIYNTAGDRGRVEEVLTVFTEDGVLDIPGRTLAGKSAIAAFLSGVAETGSDSVDLRGSRHHLTTSRIDLVGEDVALGWTYFYVMRAGQVIQEGTYIDRFTRTAEGWRIAHRRVKILWTLGD